MRYVFAIVVILAAILGYAAYSALMYYDNNFRYGRMWETPAVRPLEQPTLVMEEGVIPHDGGDGYLKTVGAPGIESPFLRDDMEAIQSGGRAYALFCVQCHGENMDGRGTVGQSFHPLPRDLTGPRVRKRADHELFNAVSYGEKRMPALATTVPVDTRWAILAYIRSKAAR